MGRTRRDHTITTIVGVYRPPSGSNLDFFGEFTEWLTDDVVLDPNIVITGDFNLHINNPNDDVAANFRDPMVTLAVFHLTLAQLPMASRPYQQVSDFQKYSPSLVSAKVERKQKI